MVKSLLLILIDMITSSNGDISPLLVLCVGNSPVTSEFSAQRPVTQSFDVYFDLCLNKRLSKQLWGWWFETLSHPLWSHCNDYCNIDYCFISTLLKIMTGCLLDHTLALLVLNMMMRSLIFNITCPLWGESTSHWWIPITKVSDTELWCFIWYAPEQIVEHHLWWLHWFVVWAW